MTCIVALKHNDKVYMGADSALSMSTHIVSVEDKIYLSPNGVLIGFAGTRILHDFRIMVNIDPKMDYDDDYTNAVQSVLRSNDKIFQGMIILFSAGKSITFMTASNWFRCNEPYYAIGDGYQYALGSLYSSKNKKDPHKRLTQALAASEKYCSSVRAPFYYNNTI